MYTIASTMAPTAKPSPVSAAVSTMKNVPTASVAGTTDGSPSASAWEGRFMYILSSDAPTAPRHGATQ